MRLSETGWNLNIKTAGPLIETKTSDSEIISRRRIGREATIGEQESGTNQAAMRS
jgi:hypothetical protein